MGDADPQLDQARAVAAAWPWPAPRIERLTGGLINHTFRVTLGDDAAPVAVLQRLHLVFGRAVNLDLDAVTAHLAGHGLVTPRLVRTRDGAVDVLADDGVWRALNWVDGTVVHAVPDATWAEAAGALVGRAHLALADFDYAYQHVRTGVHDTAAHLARLEQALARPAGEDEPADLDDARRLAHELLRAAATRPALGALPRRHCHGDLKISNLMFTVDGGVPTGRCLLDLDTFAHGTLAFELGDALRSWCNPRGEDLAGPRFELPLFIAAMRGYLGVAGAATTPAEREAVVTGLETVCLELAARFCVDVFDDRYFGWDPARFPSRRAHNLVRARGQLALATSVRAQRAAALDAVR